MIRNFPSGKRDFFLCQFYSDQTNICYKGRPEKAEQLKKSTELEFMDDWLSFVDTSVPINGTWMEWPGKISLFPVGIVIDYADENELITFYPLVQQHWCTMYHFPHFLGTHSSYSKNSGPAKMLSFCLFNHPGWNASRWLCYGSFPRSRDTNGKIRIGLDSGYNGQYFNGKPGGGWNQNIFFSKCVLFITCVSLLLLSFTIYIKINRCWFS